MLIRALRHNDVHRILGAYQAINRTRPPELYARYLSEQATGHRVVWIAEDGPFFLGHACIEWYSRYEPFRTLGIPEISDLVVMPAHRCGGIGTELIDVAEQTIAERADIAGIGVGLYADYADALRLYLRRGYLPDGRGIAYNGRTVPPGETIRVDEGATLQLTKLLR